jgi:hypothetical protein
VVASAGELELQRSNTAAFIAADPTTIALIPSVQTKLPSGGVEISPGSPQPAQTFRLIPMSHTERPTRAANSTGSETGLVRKHDFTLLGNWDAVWQEGDFWDDAEGKRWVIDALVPDNGYQRKAMVTAFRQES